MRKRNLPTGLIALMSALFIALGCLAPAQEAHAADIPQVTSSPDDEMRAVWIKYDDFNPKKYSNSTEFSAYIGNIFDNCVNIGMNSVMVHVRPFCDAMYDSKYYPWSYYASGKQGRDPGFDPLNIMVREAHKRGLKIHAWLNPYRVTNSGTDVTKLAKSNPARKWLTNKKTTDDRYVLAYGNKLYLNPSKPAVQKLIVNGVKEIVNNYAVDGIHFDDYFYPAFTKETYETAFDAPEYEEYVTECIEAGKDYTDIDHWRRNNVNTLIKTVYSAIKKIDSNVVFGISPGGYIDYFDDYYRWYVDYRTWMGKKGYIDYICPQLYWSFSDLNLYPFRKVLAKWAAVKRHSSVKLYIGLPMYKMYNKNYKIDSATPILDAEMFDYETIGRMVTHCRAVKGVSGFFFFDYIDMVDSRNKTAVEYIMEQWD